MNIIKMIYFVAIIAADTVKTIQFHFRRCI